MKYAREIILSFILVLALGLMQYPFGMSQTGEMLVLGIFLAVFAVFIFFLFRERPRDEREESERAAISRFSYFAAAVMLVIGITVTELKHERNPWLLGALVVMTLAKIAGSLYFKSRE